MIKIERSNLSNILKTHVKNVIKYIPIGIFSGKDQRYLEKNLFDILSATPDQFDKYIKETKSMPKSKVKAAFVGSQKSSWRKAGNYTGYNHFSSKGTTPYNAYHLSKSLKVNVCPYCNKNYTYTVINKKNKIVRPQFDHFISKEKYPILALSFYNLIPSCSDCNASIKGRKEFGLDTHLHPYVDDFNAIKEFSTKGTLLSLVTKKSEFEIIFETREDVLSELEKKADKVIEDFALREVYSKHKDIVLELLDKSRAYNDASIDNIKKDTKIFKEKEDILRLITCGYMEDEKLDQRPLSKLIKDIYEKLES